MKRFPFLKWRPDFYLQGQIDSGERGEGKSGGGERGEGNLCRDLADFYIAVALLPVTCERAGKGF